MNQLDVAALCAEINRISDEDHCGSYPGHDVVIALVAKAERERVLAAFEALIESGLYEHREFEDLIAKLRAGT